MNKKIIIISFVLLSYLFWGYVNAVTQEDLEKELKYLNWEITDEDWDYYDDTDRIWVDWDAEKLQNNNNVKIKTLNIKTEKLQNNIDNISNLTEWEWEYTHIENGVEKTDDISEMSFDERQKLRDENYSELNKAWIDTNWFWWGTDTLIDAQESLNEKIKKDIEDINNNETINTNNQNQVNDVDIRKEKILNEIRDIKKTEHNNEALFDMEEVYNQAWITVMDTQNEADDSRLYANETQANTDKIQASADSAQESYDSKQNTANEANERLSQAKTDLEEAKNNWSSIEEISDLESEVYTAEWEANVAWFAADWAKEEADKKNSEAEEAQKKSTEANKNAEEAENDAAKAEEDYKKAEDVLKKAEEDVANGKQINSPEQELVIAEAKKTEKKAAEAKEAEKKADDEEAANNPWLEKIWDKSIFTALTWVWNDNNIVKFEGDKWGISVLNSVFVWIKNTLTWFILIIAVAVFLFIWIRLAMARWNPEEFKKAIMQLVYAIVWIFIVSIAWAAVVLVTWLNI